MQNLGILPVGAIVPFPTVLSSNTGWLQLNGSFVLRVDFPLLCASFDDANTFHSGQYVQSLDPDGYHLPNMNAFLRTIVGASVAQSAFYTGEIGGEKEHQLTEDEMFRHRHGVGVGTSIMHANDPNGQVGWSSGQQMSGTPFTGYVGDDQPHNNMPPYMAAFWHILAKQVPDTIIDDFDERYIRNVFALDCVLYQTRIEDEFIVDIAECARQAIEDKPWDDPEDENTPSVIPEDCVWGAIDALVEQMVSWAKDFLDLVENALDLANDLLEWLPTKFPGMTKYAPALEIIKIATYGGQIGIIAARADLTNQSMIDDWKCNLFCAVYANGNVLTVPIWVDWLEYLSPLIPPYTSMGGLAMHVLAYAMGTDYLFKRFILYSDRCNDDWEVLCECGGGTPTCVALDITWNSHPETPAAWHGERKPTGSSTWYTLLRDNNENWESVSDWDTIAVEYQPDTPCLMAEWVVYANRTTNNQMTIRLYLYNAADEQIGYDSWFYPINTSPPPSWSIINNSGQPVARLRAEVGSKRVRITRNKVII